MSYDPHLEPTPVEMEATRRGFAELRASLIARGIDADVVVRRGMDLIAKHAAASHASGATRENDDGR